ncbi:hypothetical protein [Ferrovum sp.]|uniref:hypothetical protein n=1 Tax=Ferrovum sp. TaxID=2609467 RepID=UPI00260BB299|nr:hypothetical protein [Ferrovum sp.]
MASGCALGTIPTKKGEEIMISQDLHDGLPLLMGDLNLAYMAFYPNSPYFYFALVGFLIGLVAAFEEG